MDLLARLSGLDVRLLGLRLYVYDLCFWLYGYVLWVLVGGVGSFGGFLMFRCGFYLVVDFEFVVFECYDC